MTMTVNSVNEADEPFSHASDKPQTLNPKP